MIDPLGSGDSAQGVSETTSNGRAEEIEAQPGAIEFRIDIEIDDLDATTLSIDFPSTGFKRG